MRYCKGNQTNNCIFTHIVNQDENVSFKAKNTCSSPYSLPLLLLSQLYSDYESAVIKAAITTALACIVLSCTKAFICKQIASFLMEGLEMTFSLNMLNHIFFFFLNSSSSITFWKERNKSPLYTVNRKCLLNTLQI